MNSKVQIISCGLGSGSLSQRALEAVSAANKVYGGKRLLALFPDYNGERVEIGANFRDCVAQIVAHISDDLGDIVVLGSGDSLLFGIANSFVDKLEADQISIIPNVTAAQGLFSAAGISWDRVTFYSIHGRSCELPWIQILNAELPVVYCDYKRTPADVARELILQFPACAQRKAVVGENLGSDGERITSGTLMELFEKEFSSLAVIALLPTSGEELVSDPGLMLGRDDDEFIQYNNMLTHSEVRAVAVSKLRLGNGVMWDLGAGSGSVSIEAAMLCEGLEVYAVEYHDERIAVINDNIQKFAAENITVVKGRILDVIDDLPQPRSVFVGGGGREVAEIVERGFDALLPGGVLVASAVLLETQMALASVLTEECSEVVTLNISRSKKLGDSRMMKGSNPITLFVYKK